jgi:hypothetical protein
MGLDITPLLFVGRIFRNRATAAKWFKAHRTLSEHDLDGIGDELLYFLEENKKNGFPQGQSLSAYDRDGEVYVGYAIHDSNPEKMIENIRHFSAKWQEFFNDAPEVVLEARYH